MTLSNYGIKEGTCYVTASCEEQMSDLRDIAIELGLTPNNSSGYGRNCVYFNFKYRFYGYCGEDSSRAIFATEISDKQLMGKIEALSCSIKNNI